MGSEITKQPFDLTNENTDKEQSQQQIQKRRQIVQKKLQKESSKLKVILQESVEQLLISKQNNDQRRRITSHQFHHSPIGRVQPTYKNSSNQKWKGSGTGCLIAHNIVLTAAHNMFSRERRKFAQSVLFSLKQGNKEFKSYQAIYVFVPKQYINLKSDNSAKLYDYAILILNTQGLYLGKQYGTLHLHNNITFQQLQNVQNIVQVYGYPGDRNQKDRNSTCKNQYGCSGKIKQISEKFILHLVDTNKGQSGAPILIRVQQNNRTIYKVIGIHTRGDKVQLHNIGVKITDQIIDKINQWIQNLQKANKNYIQVPEHSLEEEEQFNNTSIEKCLKYKHNKNKIQDQINIIKMSCLEWNKSSHRVNQKYITDQNIQRAISEVIPYNYKSLEKLFVRNQLLDYHRIECILETISLTAIIQIDLQSNKITSEGIKAFTQFYKIGSNFHYNQFSSLQKLTFSNNPIQNEGFLHLMNPEIFPKLKELRIQNCGVGSLQENQSTFQQIKLLIVRLKKLNMNSNLLIYQDIIKLFDCKSLKQFKMEQLNISSNKIQGKSLQVLGSQAFFSLKKLRMAKNKMSLKMEDIQKIQIEPFPKLELLSLWGNNLTKQSIKLIVNLQIFRNVSILSLDQNNIGSDGLQFILDNQKKPFPRLIKLDISKCRISKRGINYLINKKNQLSQLRELYANFNKFKNKKNIKNELKEAFNQAYIQAQ